MHDAKFYNCEGGFVSTNVMATDILHDDDIFIFPAIITTFSLTRTELLSLLLALV
jgi:hypothetical protein